MATKKITINELRSIVKQIIKEESEVVDLKQYCTKIAAEHGLHLMQGKEKPELYKMWLNEKGNFGDKNGVLSYNGPIQTTQGNNGFKMTILTNEEKLTQAIYERFKNDRGGNDQGFETQTFNENGVKAYFKSFSITK